MNQSCLIYSLKHPLVLQIVAMWNFAFSEVSDNLRSVSMPLFREKDRSTSTLDIGANRKSGMSAVFHGDPDESPSPWSTDKIFLNTLRPLLFFVTFSSFFLIGSGFGPMAPSTQDSTAARYAKLAPMDSFVHSSLARFP